MTQVPWDRCTGGHGQYGLGGRRGEDRGPKKVLEQAGSGWTFIYCWVSHLCLGEATYVSEMLTSLVSLMKGQWLLLQVGSFRGGHRGLQQIREVTRAWGQGGCNRLGKIEKKVQCCSSVGEWTCGGKLKGDPQNNTVIIFTWGCGGESGKYHSGI